MALWIVCKHFYDEHNNQKSSKSLKKYEKFKIRDFTLDSKVQSGLVIVWFVISLLKDNYFRAIKPKEGLTKAKSLWAT